MEVRKIEYTVNKLAKISGVSTRTLRYYDEIGLLKPARVNSNNYRIYGENEVDTLQQILFYRELDVNLDEIKIILSAPEFNVQISLQEHLKTLIQKRERIDLLIQNVTKTTQFMRGETIMTDNEKFEGFKQNLINENEIKYGEEIREKYGSDAIDAPNAKIKGMTKEQYDEVEKLRIEFEQTLKLAFETNDPASDLAQKACELHKQWLCFFYEKYSREYHRNLGEMYVADKRFSANYDKLGPNCTEFLRDAINIFCVK